MDKVLVEMGEGGGWLPGNGYFVLYERYELELNNHLSIYCVGVCMCVCVYMVIPPSL